MGLHIENIHQFSMKDKVYFVEGWYWLRWPAEIQKIIETKKIELTKIIEFSNQVENSSFSNEPDTSESEKSGRKSHVSTVSVFGEILRETT